MKKEYIILVAPPCSGKSTWVENYIKYYPKTIVVSRDDVLMEFANDIDHDMSYNTAFKMISQKKVDKEYKKRLLNSYMCDSSVIVDATNLSSKRRKGILINVNSDFLKKVIVFEWDKKRFLKWNEKRTKDENKFISEKLWDNMVSNYRQPTKDEGYDILKIIKINESN